uniref:Uncharacterized protein n=1 Tax=Panagrolaimus sp. JU765 TaxID=591449 RepID=A0AC34R4Q5_9BILA
MALKARLRHHERKEASAKKNQRKDSTLKLEDGEVYIDGKISCAIPKIPCCRLGQSLPENLRDGVKLKCTNEKCIYTKKLVHYQCFEQLEHTLMALLGVQGSARGWTENQKRHNLWEKKGMSLLQRQLRCHCGKGQVVRDSEAWMEREKLLEPEEEKPKKAQKKVKKLPTLNFNQKAPPGVDPKKIQELDYFSSAALESALEDKYGPPKVTPTRIRTKLLEPEEEKPKKAQKKVKKLPTLNFNQKAPPGVDP